MKRALQKPAQKPKVPANIVRKAEQSGSDVCQAGQHSTEQDDKVGVAVFNRVVFFLMTKNCLGYVPTQSTRILSLLIKVIILGVCNIGPCMKAYFLPGRPFIIFAAVKTFLSHLL